MERRSSRLSHNNCRASCTTEEPLDQLSSREQRKLLQMNAILQKQEIEKLQKIARRIVKKESRRRSSDEIKFAQEYPGYVLEAQRRRDQKLLERTRQLEILDDERELDTKSRMLADVLRTAKHAIVYTGAGISTAANIPDYRGPNGLWTRQQQGVVDTDEAFDLTTAQPTFTHMALVKLVEEGLIKYIVSQNCDGLHVRSGLPRSCLSEIHGNMYLESCHECEPDVEYFRTFDVTHKTRWRRHRTGRRCYECDGELQDTIVLFGEKSRTESPMYWETATSHCQDADVIVCLGSSLKVLKDYPSLWNAQSKLCIINLQWTPKDDDSQLKIHGRCDDVMRRVLSHLSMIPPTYDPATDPLLKLAVPLRDGEEQVQQIDQSSTKAYGWLGLGATMVKKKKESKHRHKKKKA